VALDLLHVYGFLDGNIVVWKLSTGWKTEEDCAEAPSALVGVVLHGFIELIEFLLQRGQVLGLFRRDATLPWKDSGTWSVTAPKMVKSITPVTSLQKISQNFFKLKYFLQKCKNYKYLKVDRNKYCSSEALSQSVSICLRNPIQPMA